MELLGIRARDDRVARLTDQLQRVEDRATVALERSRPVIKHGSFSCASNGNIDGKEESFVDPR